MAEVTFESVAIGLRARSVLVTTASNGARAGGVVRFHTQFGIAPIRYAVWLPTAGHTYEVARLATYLAVHVVEDDSMTVTGPPTALGEPDDDPLDGYDWRPGPGGVPLLTTCPCLVLGSISIRIEPGGYACVFGEVVHIASPPVNAWTAAATVDVTRPVPGAPHQQPAEHERDHLLHVMDAEARRQFINAAIGAGHAIDWSDHWPQP
jgi:flavin reductase (DIM6/NTAB) family NADH-FMN oxidoreductase RutF